MIVDNPKTFLQAIRYNEFDKWLDAIKDNLTSMKANQVWDLIPLLEAFVQIQCKSIFKTKWDPKENVNHHKTILIDKIFTQRK